MFALALDFETRRLGAREAPEPVLERDDEVLFRVTEVGICGTDRALTRFDFGEPPEGARHLILGHEAVGRVERVGSGVKEFAVGDIVVPMVRRPCAGPCAGCGRGRADLCYTARYTERGIMRAHGYFAERAVDRAEFLVRVPELWERTAVLIEPLSVVEKAVRAALGAHEGEPKSAVVLGAGAIGILTALALAGRGLEVTVKSLEPETGVRARVLASAGCRYTRGNAPKADLVIEAAGASAAAFEAIELLEPCGVAVILGAMNSSGLFPFRDLILGNRKVIGIVNAARADFESAVRELSGFEAAQLSQLIERRPRSGAVESMNSPAAEAVKLVHTVGE